MAPIIIGNWKMNPQSLAEARKLFGLVQRGVKNSKKVEVVVCPPFVYLSELGIKNKEFNVKLGAQDIFWENPPADGGAFTGEISPLVLKNLGCEYVIIGHSERRKYLNETDEMINKKLKAVFKIGLKPILCIGSKKMGKKGNEEIKLQLREALLGVEKSKLKNIIFTYEPIWAISTTKGSVVATPENTKEGAILIKKTVAKIFGRSIKIKVIYGGSVDSTNIKSFIKKAEMEGALIGAASLRANDFIKAVKIIDLLS